MLRILFRAENNVLEMQATDYQTGIRISVPAQVEEAGEVVIMASTTGNGQKVWTAL